MEDIYKQALQLENKMKSAWDQPGHAAAQAFRQEVQRLLDEIQTKLNPRSLENRVQNIKRQADNMPEAVMSHGDQDDLKDRCDDLIQSLRRLQ